MSCSKLAAPALLLLLASCDSGSGADAKAAVLAYPICESYGGKGTVADVYDAMARDGGTEVSWSDDSSVSGADVVSALTTGGNTLEIHWSVDGDQVELVGMKGPNGQMATKKNAALLKLVSTGVFGVGCAGI